MFVFSNYPKITRFLIQLIDLVITFLSLLLAIFVRDLLRKIIPFGIDSSLSEQQTLLLLIMGLWWILLSIADLYTPHRFSTLKSECKIVINTVFKGSIILLVLAFLFKYYFPRSLIILFTFINLILLLFEKYLLYILLRSYLRKKSSNLKSVLVVGAGDKAQEFVESVHKYPDWGMKIIGFVDNNEERVGELFCGSLILGTYKNFAQILKDNVVDEVIFALSPKHLGEIEELLKICEIQGVEARIISDFFKLMIAKTKVDQIHGIPIITFSTKPSDDLQLLIKRIIDILVSFTMLVILSPLFLVIMIAIKLTSPGPIFYQWNVVGLNKKKFKSYKFRTMVPDADLLKKDLLDKNEMKGVVFKMKDDPRITKVGKFLRKYSLDELPQLFSVLKGDMSLVGPRPPLVTEFKEFDYWHRRKLSVKPGLTCLWQVNGRNEIKDFDEWMKLDLEYIDNWSLWLDFKILLKTIPVVLSGTGR